MDSIIDVQNLNVILDHNLILDKIKVAIPKGKITVIVGPSGSGKSTFLKSLVKLCPSSGTILFNGESINSLDILQLRKKMIYVSQIPITFEGTVHENVVWINRINPEIVVNPQELIVQVGLSEDFLKKDATSISIGQKQRVHLARSLALDPDVLLLDEPASALDAISKEKFENLIKNLKENKPGLSILMITHDLHQAQRVADYAVLLVDGKITLSGPSESFFKEINNLPEADVLRNLMEVGI